jgi:hypothetical protein
MAVIADVFEVALIDSTTGDAIGTTTLTEANIQVQVKENDVRGSRGNQLMGVLHSDRDITLNLTDISFKYDWIAKQLGQNIVTGAGTGYATPKWYSVATEKITLDETPSDTSSLVIYNASGVKITGFTVTTDQVDFTAATPTVANGDSVEVRTYKYATDAQTQTIEIDNSVFAKGVIAVLETLEVDESTEVATHKIQYQFDRALPSGNFTISTRSEKTASTQAFNLRVVKPATSTVVGRVLRIPVA